ncbi:hypothetical protein P175DRAFT_0498328 [Aspergillus ochraceoroseus IBT 24754]|uniref:C2 domain-containing protein n=2 Tax=Aspergillus ochraceoroseus TaxID=138278 RepID=A0A2T5M9L4_9EURO|nr:uncharacterized protein P175DRAFT_0498328 [Aspergillus ochraceoroseus IBT 24754]KKK24036.1 hypothetical protein AOCH_006882 [Aspergillus ochraceoroseus]PTU25224.1 hypothetical protein P175DRAFT_0498328 [Aspergillus ochraceoroseus IBT 24754]
MAAKPVRLSNLNHAAGIFADMSVDGPAIGTLVAIVDRAKNLPNRKTMGKQNPYCAARLGKEAKKTDTDLRGGQTPKWDQELRFTVHESPDYFKMKVSVFNDDKRTDLIGETWVDLKDLIIPGGSQSDQWHPLQFRGKYAGEIRLEMTYYDTRPEDEAVIERRTHVVDKVVTKNSSSPAPVGSSSLAGPRQLKEVKRRPLPVDPAGSTASRPAHPEKSQPAPAPVPVQPHPPRPAQYDNIPTPPSSSGADYVRHSPRHQDPGYDTPLHAVPPQGVRPTRNYETPDDFQREWNPPAQAQAQGPPRRHPQEHHYSYPERPAEPQETRSYHSRPQSGYDNAPSADYRTMRQDLPAGRQESYHSEPADMYAPVQHDLPRPSSHHHNQPYPAQDQYGYDPDEIQQPQAVRYQSHASGSMSSRHKIEYPQDDPGMASGEPERHYRPHSNSLPMRGRSPARHPVSRESYHAEYAAMQPRVEDEEEEGPPPPPPVHRSGLVQSSQQLVPSPTPSYKAYSPEYCQSPRTSHEVNLSQPSQLMLEEDRFQDLPLPTDGPAMPPSLVAGLDPSIADAESDRTAHEIQARRRSGIFEEKALVRANRGSSPMLPPYPTDITTPPLEERRRSFVGRGSINADNSPAQHVEERRRSFVSRGPMYVENTHHQLVSRKSVSPRPPPSRGQESSLVPFSPDSFDAFNPNAARSAVTRDPAPAYESPAEAMEAARRTEAEASRKPGPIIGDDGREIDPSDHLPTDTWAPEPDRKSRKPGVIVRFRNAPARTSRIGPPAPQEYSPGRTTTTTTTTAAAAAATTTTADWNRRPMSSYMPGADPMDRTSPRADFNRGREGYRGNPSHARTYSTPNGTPSPRAPRRNSVSPSPSPSSLYAPPNIGPPIPAKVPIGAPTGNVPGPVGRRRPMDALSRELNAIDIGSVGCSSGRAMRKYVPKTVTGYAL